MKTALFASVYVCWYAFDDRERGERRVSVDGNFEGQRMQRPRVEKGENTTNGRVLLYPSNFCFFF